MVARADNDKNILFGSFMMGGSVTDKCVEGTCISKFPIGETILRSIERRFVCATIGSVPVDH